MGNSGQRVDGEGFYKMLPRRRQSNERGLVTHGIPRISDPSAYPALLHIHPGVRQMPLLIRPHQRYHLEC